jgi:hypothetical protein
MERGVPKDCTKRCATLPKRLGNYFWRFFPEDKFLKTADFLKRARTSRLAWKKVGMGIALGLSALLT